MAISKTTDQTELKFGLQVLIGTQALTEEHISSNKDKNVYITETKTTLSLPLANYSEAIPISDISFLKKYKGCVL